MNLASRSHALLCMVAAFCALGSACSNIDDPARLVAIIDADFAVRAHPLRRGRARERRRLGRLGQARDHTLCSQADPQRLAAARDAAGVGPPRERILGGNCYGERRGRRADCAGACVSDSLPIAPLELALHFDAGCTDGSERCGQMLSCRDGVCVDAGVPLVEMSRSDGGTGMQRGEACDGGADCPAAADDCGADRGGCDPLAACRKAAGKPICGACPSGFAGTGSSGCIATLLDVKLSEGELQPAFSPDQIEYLVELPLLAALSLQPSAAQGVSIRIDGATVESGARWMASLQAAGESREVTLTASAPDHAGRTYKLTIRRALRSRERLVAPHAATDDQLGYVLGLSGDTLVAGAPFEDGGRLGPGQSAAVKDSGAAYVFVRSGVGWVQQAYLRADTPLAGASFGRAVAIDGDRIAIGARNDSGSGAVYVFEREGDTWHSSAVLRVENVTANIAFGAALALRGELLAIGAVGDADVAADSGAVFLYEHGTGGWTRVARLKAAKPGALDWLGSSVAFEGDWLVTGASGEFVDDNPCGAVHVFLRTAGVWQDQGILPAKGLEAGALFGSTLAMSADTVAVGAFNGTAGFTSGAVFLFVRESAGGFRQQAVVRATNPESGDFFGLQLALSGDQLLVGASRQSVAAVGGAGSLDRAGAAYLFARQAAVWRPIAQLAAPEPAAQQQFGYGVALAGRTLAIGAIGDTGGGAGANSGAVFVFE